ncbi:hypothetical protein TcBrA4_0099000 [Trypanosoma cruzi]|nr:hypothetical protein TcBrA4_0099000 [Trypanosoma cruzi]
MNVSRRARGGWRTRRTASATRQGRGCAGQYPPAKEIQEMLARRIDYGQLEDFNRGKRDDGYYRATCVASAMKAWLETAEIVPGAQIRFRIRVCARKGRCVWSFPGRFASPNHIFILA